MNATFQPIVCPHCQGRDVSLCDTVPVLAPVAGVRDGRLIYDDNREQRVLWDASRAEQNGLTGLLFWCDDCDGEFSVPGVTE